MGCQGICAPAAPCDCLLHPIGSPLLSQMVEDSLNTMGRGLASSFPPSDVCDSVGGVALVRLISPGNTSSASRGCLGW